MASGDLPLKSSLPLYSTYFKASNGQYLTHCGSPLHKVHIPKGLRLALIWITPVRCERQALAQRPQPIQVSVLLRTVMGKGIAVHGFSTRDLIGFDGTGFNAGSVFAQ